MTDPTDLRGAPGYDTAMNSFGTASKTLQEFANEVQRLGRESYERTTQLMEKMRSAKTVEDVLSIQTGFMQQSFAMSSEYTRRFGELMMTLPMEMARNSRDAFQKGTEAMQQAGDQVGSELKKAGDEFKHHQG